jgi:hypothetical protein
MKKNMREKPEKAVMVTMTLYPSQLEVLREYAREKGLMSEKNKDGINLSGALQAVIDDWLKLTNTKL